MGIKYTCEQLEQMIAKASQNMSRFYKECPSHKANIKGSDRPDDDFSAEYILTHLVEGKNGEFVLKGIESKDRRNEYFDKPRKVEMEISEREEIFERYLYYGGELDDALKKELEGETFFWYELSDKDGNGHGIDLLSYNQRLKRLTIYELKFGSDVHQYLLHAVLEIETYYQRTDYEKLKRSWERNYANANKPEAHFENLKLEFKEQEVRKVLFLDKRTDAYKQSEAEAATKYPNVQSLMKKFKIEVLGFDGGYYTKERMDEFLCEKLKTK